MNTAREPNLGGRTRASASSSNGGIAVLPGLPVFFDRPTSGNNGYSRNSITGRPSLPLCGAQHNIYTRNVKLYGCAIPSTIGRKAAALHSGFRPITLSRAAAGQEPERTGLEPGAAIGNAADLTLAGHQRPAPTLLVAP
jgi:hypothetical protein